MAFDIPFFVKMNKLYYKCEVNPANNKTEWMYTKPGRSKCLVKYSGRRLMGSRIIGSIG